jgi:hypothetical protein
MSGSGATPSKPGWVNSPLGPRDGSTATLRYSSFLGAIPGDAVIRAGDRAERDRAGPTQCNTYAETNRDSPHASSLPLYSGTLSAFGGSFQDLSANIDHRLRTLRSCAQGGQVPFDPYSRAIFEATTLIGFVVPWRIATLEGFAYRATAFSGGLVLGDGSSAWSGWA